MANETTMTVVGNLTAVPELRYTPAGVAICKFTVASTPRVFDKQSNTYKDGEPLFMRCTAWRSMAEHVAESLDKGNRVVVTGRLRQSHWEDKTTGEKRSGFDLDVDDIGPSLLFATAKVQRLSRTSRAGDGFVPDEVPGDEWSIAAASPAGAAPASVAA